MLKSACVPMVCHRAPISRTRAWVVRCVAAYVASTPPVRLSKALLFSFDTETTGVDTQESRIVQLGAAYMVDGVRVGRRRGMLVNPGVPIPREASEVHGVRDVDVESAPCFGDVAPRFVDHILGGPDGQQPPVLLGYNAIAYDVPLLNSEFARHGIAFRIDPSRVLDPMIWLSWHKRDWPKRTLAAASAAYGHELKDAHSASADAEATGAVLRGLLDERVMPDELEGALQQQAV